jgi:hypothetical protein
MSFDLTATATMLLGRLGATSWADLDWLTEAEVFSYFDEAAKRLAQECGIFVIRDTSDNLANGTSQYATPAGWLSTIHVSAGSTRLRPASASELLALDATYTATTGTPARYSMDAGPLGTVTIYPTPTRYAALCQVCHVFPQPDITQSAPTAPISSPISDYFLYFALWRARGRQSESSMPEIASHAEARCKQFEEMFNGYYGDGE